VIVGILSVTSSSDAKVARQFLSAVRSGKGDDSYKLLSATTQASEDQQQWSAKISKIAGFYTKVKHKATVTIAKKSKTENGVFTETYQATGKDGEYIMSVTVQDPIKGKPSVLSFTSAPGIYTEATTAQETK
jgi:hypothetical protein